MGLFNNGEANVSISGGSAPYTYKLFNSLGVEVDSEFTNNTSHTFTGIEPGEYTVRITDNNSPACEVLQEITVDSWPCTNFDIINVTSTDETEGGLNDGTLSFQIQDGENWDGTQTTGPAYTVSVQFGSTTLTPTLVAGTYSLQDLEPGTYIISAESDGADGCVTSHIVVITAGIVETNRTIYFFHGGQQADHEIRTVGPWDQTAFQLPWYVDGVLADPYSKEEATVELMTRIDAGTLTGIQGGSFDLAEGINIETDGPDAPPTSFGATTDNNYYYIIIPNTAEFPDTSYFTSAGRFILDGVSGFPVNAAATYPVTYNGEPYNVYTIGAAESASAKVLTFA